MVPRQHLKRGNDFLGNLGKDLNTCLRLSSRVNCNVKK